MHETRLRTRWNDFDALGHLTHIAYPMFFDEARDAFFAESVGEFDAFPVVIVHLSIDHHGEIRRPAPEIVVRTRVTAVGRTSMTFEQELSAGEEVAATAKAVVVAWDGAARAARALTDAERARLS